MKSKLFRKILLSILGIASLIYIVIGALIISDAYLTLQNTTRKFLINNSLAISKYFSAIIENDINVLRTMKATIQDFPQFNTKLRDRLELMIYNNVLRENTQLLSIGRSWEIRAVDSTYIKPYGRYRILVYWLHGELAVKGDTLELNGDNITGLYYQFKISKKPGITQIYVDDYTGKKVLMTTIIEPIIKNGDFIGAIYADISLERFEKILKKLNTLTQNKLILISHRGKVIASTGMEQPMLDFNKLFNKKNIYQDVQRRLKTTNYYSFQYQDSVKNKYFITVAPVRFANYDQIWGLINIFPVKIIDQENRKLLKITLLGLIIGFIILIFLSIFFAYHIITPLNKIVEVIKELSDRNIDVAMKLNIQSKDEIGEISKSVNELIDALNEVTVFATEIGKGNLSVKLNLAGERDVLGNALLQMQKSLKIAKIEDQKRQTEERIQRWIIEGEAKFAEIMRQYSNDFEQLTYQTIKNLVEYIDAQQGGLFIVNDEDKENPYLELVASYAYGRRKHLKKIIPFGVGLVGRVVLEKEPIYLTDLPEDYTNIVSGLGETKPRSLIIVPFKFNEIIYAVAEIASMNELKPYQRRFIERVGVSIASTIANLKITMQTNKLVEELKKRTQELATQEEEMRQNIEEMRVTQEEMKRKNREFESIVNALNQIAFVLEYDMDQRLININQLFLNFLGVRKEDILYTKLGAYLDKEDREKLQDIWHQVLMGRIQTTIQHHLFGKREFWFKEAYVPVFDEEGKPYKVINIIIDITEIMQKNNNK